MFNDSFDKLNRIIDRTIGNIEKFEIRIAAFKQQRGINSMIYLKFTLKGYKMLLSQFLINYMMYNFYTVFLKGHLNCFCFRLCYVYIVKMVTILFYGQVNAPMAIRLP